MRFENKYAALERFRSDSFRQQTLILFDIKFNLTALKNSNRSHSFEQNLN